jgi:hypothetical protein
LKKALADLAPWFLFCEEAGMEFPSKDEFLGVFGIEPVEENPNMAYCRYVKTGSAGKLEIDFSFSAVTESFQVVLRCGGEEVAEVSSEKVKSIKISQDNLASYVHVVFDIDGVTSEALIRLEPELNCRWWTLRKA